MPNLNALNVENLIQLVTFDFTAFGEPIQRFCDTTTYEGSSEQFSPIRFQNNDYMPLPFQSGGFQRGGENMVRPSFQIGDYSGVLYEQLRDMTYAPGAPVTRMLVLKADILANNPFAVFQTERYVLNRVSKQGFILDLELATHIDFAMRKFPGTVMMTEDFPALNSSLSF